MDNIIIIREANARWVIKDQYCWFADIYSRSGAIAFAKTISAHYDTIIVEDDYEIETLTRVSIVDDEWHSVFVQKQVG